MTPFFYSDFFGCHFKRKTLREKRLSKYFLTWKDSRQKMVKKFTIITVLTTITEIVIVRLWEFIITRKSYELNLL